VEGVRLVWSVRFFLGGIIYGCDRKRSGEGVILIL